MNIIQLTKQFAKKEYARHDPLHQWNHVEAVMKMAIKLASFYPETDLEILKLSVMLHDISYEKYETHVDESVKVAEKFLRKNKYPEDKIKKVKTVILAHSSPHRKKLGDTDLIEGKVLYDSDKFYMGLTNEGYKKYHDTFYLKETKEILEQKREKRRTNS